MDLARSASPSVPHVLLAAERVESQRTDPSAEDASLFANIASTALRASTCWRVSGSREGCPWSWPLVPLRPSRAACSSESRCLRSCTVTTLDSIVGWALATSLAAPARKDALLRLKAGEDSHPFPSGAPVGMLVEAASDGRLEEQLSTALYTRNVFFADLLQ